MATYVKRTLRSNVFLKESLCNRAFQATFIEERLLYSNPEPLYNFLESASQSNILGIAGSYVPATEESQRDCTACLLTKLAVATPEQVLVISLHFGSEDPADVVDHTLIYESFFSETKPRSYVGFNVDRLALQLFGEYGLLIQNGIDALALNLRSIDQPRTPSVFAKAKANKDIFLPSALLEILKNEDDILENDNRFAIRAWVGAVLEQVSENYQASLLAIPPINLYNLKFKELIELKKALQSSDRLRESVPELQSHDITVERRDQGKFVAISNQFNSRVRFSDQDFELVFEGVTVTARIKKVKGKTAELKLSESINRAEAGELTGAFTLGRPEATNLDHQRSNLILFALQGKASILENPFLKQIWFPDQCPSQTTELPSPELFGEQWKKLNRSQLKAVKEMLKESSDPRIVLVHGPPGTGKTSVIAAMTESLLLSGSQTPMPSEGEEIVRAPNSEESDSDDESRNDGPTMWIIAQSNVAVKNVAEKLLKIGIEQFKLVVSGEFHFEWHEHLYEKIKARTCTTGELPLNKGEVATFLRGVRVVLCTLSMITSHRLRELCFHEIIPVQNVVVDEASQIQLGDLLPLLHIFGSEMKRLCLVGDHKQLAPYGQEEVEEIESIFEKKHIVEGATLLNITYRLPKPISNIISSEVYGTKLIPWSNEERPTCCKWIDVPGEEQVPDDSTSPVNIAEIEACLLLAKELEGKQKEYRIISPYASQTNRILKRMKEDNMQWEDKCFNVDSFQGNEAEYIIISLVRTEKIGFLSNNRRANVLLTRCKKGMFILCCRKLIKGEAAQRTLLGRFASKWEAGLDDHTWPSYQDLLDGVEMVDEDLGPVPTLATTSTPTVSFHSAPSPEQGSKKNKGKSKQETPESPSNSKSARAPTPRNREKGKKRK